MKIAIPVAIALLLFIIPIVYFVAHVADPTFRDSAVANWFGTVIGIVVGVPIALLLAKLQQRTVDEVESKKQSIKDVEELEALRGRFLEELQFNHAAVRTLLDVLNRTSSSRTDVWDWACTVVDSFEFAAREEIEKYAFRTGGTRLQDVHYFTTCRDLKRLKHKVRQGRLEHSFYFSYGGGEESANELFERTKYFAGHVEKHTEDSISMLQDLVKAQ